MSECLAPSPLSRHRRANCKTDSVSYAEDIGGHDPMNHRDTIGVLGAVALGLTWLAGVGVLVGQAMAWWDTVGRLVTVTVPWWVP
jgi:hypothetical protein